MLRVNLEGRILTKLSRLLEELALVLRLEHLVAERVGLCGGLASGVRVSSVAERIPRLRVCSAHLS